MQGYTCIAFRGFHTTLFRAAALSASFAAAALATDVPLLDASVGITGAPIGDGRFTTSQPGSYSSAGSSASVAFDGNRISLATHAQGIPFGFDPATGKTLYSGTETAAALRFYATVEGPADAKPFDLLFSYTMTGNASEGGFFRVDGSAANYNNPYEGTYTAVLDNTGLPPVPSKSGAIGGSVVHVGDLVAFLITVHSQADPDGVCCRGFPGPITNRFVQSNAAITGVSEIDPAYAAIDLNYKNDFRIVLSPGIAPSAVPEPATWMTMLLVFVLIGIGYRWQINQSPTASLA